MLFRKGERKVPHRPSQLIGANLDMGLEDSRLSMPAAIVEHTQGFTKAPRPLSIRDSEIARRRTIVRDAWIYPVAVAGGKARILRDVPNALSASRRQCRQWARQLTTTCHRGSFHHLVTAAVAASPRPRDRGSHPRLGGAQLQRRLRLARLPQGIKHPESLAAVFRPIESGVPQSTIRDAFRLALIYVISASYAGEPL